ncbi:hypothetical protein Bbelb_272550 [Branchiostoma belcheri]|nr:hypothetical protein Bbelb_272550 [Branchiostoma belcheri]
MRTRNFVVLVTVRAVHNGINSHTRANQCDAHLSVKTIETAIKESIILLGLPTHTSHFLQQDVCRREFHNSSNHTCRDVCRREFHGSSNHTCRDVCRREFHGSSNHTCRDVCRREFHGSSNHTCRDVCRREFHNSSNHTCRDVCRREFHGSSNHTCRDVCRREFHNSSNHTCRDVCRREFHNSSNHTCRDVCRREFHNSSNHTCRDVCRREVTHPKEVTHPEVTPPKEVTHPEETPLEKMSSPEEVTPAAKDTVDAGIGDVVTVAYEDNWCVGVVKKVDKDRQLHGCAMGSPVSPIVANLYMERFETKALASFPGTPPLNWLRYVDDTWCRLKKKASVDFLEHINHVDEHIRFTEERSNNNTLPFLDTLVRVGDDGHIHKDKGHCHTPESVVEEQQQMSLELKSMGTGTARYGVGH